MSAITSGGRRLRICDSLCFAVMGVTHQLSYTIILAWAHANNIYNLVDSLYLNGQIIEGETMSLNQNHVYAARVPLQLDVNMLQVTEVFFRHQDTLPGNQWSVEAPGYFRVVPGDNASDIIKGLGANGCQLVTMPRDKFEAQLQAMKK